MERAGVRASARQVCDPPRSCPSFLTGALGRVHYKVSVRHLAGYYTPSGNAGEARPRFGYPSFRNIIALLTLPAGTLQACEKCTTLRTIHPRL